MMKEKDTETISYRCSHHAMGKCTLFGSRTCRFFSRSAHEAHPYRRCSCACEPVYYLHCRWMRGVPRTMPFCTTSIAPCFIRREVCTTAADRVQCAAEA